MLDATNRTIREVAFDGDYKSIYGFLSSPEAAVRLFQIIHLDDGDEIYVDQEGLLRRPLPSCWFRWEGFPHPLAGNGLILGSNAEGEGRSPRITVLDAAKKVLFVSVAKVVAEVFN